MSDVFNDPAEQAPAIPVATDVSSHDASAGEPAAYVPTATVEQTPALIVSDTLAAPAAPALEPAAPAPEGVAMGQAAEAAPAAEPPPAPEAVPAPQPAEIKRGKIVRVSAEQVFVVVETGQAGYVPLIEFAGQPLPRVGDDISVIIDQLDEKTGDLILSKRQADEFTFWQSVQPGDILEGVVTGMNKGGLDVDIGGARAFLPSSQVDVRRMHDISVLIGEHVRCEVSQVDRTTQDLVISRRKVQENEKLEARKQAVEQIQEGEVRTGKVSSITDFGAFVNIGGVDALLHMTDMSWGRVRPPGEVVHKGQELTVKVLKVDRAHGKVSVGLKQAKPNPWDNIQERYPEGTRVKVTVLRFAEFGAFVELEDGVDALLPISELSWTKRVGHPADMLKEGEQREVIILKVDPAKRRVSVGLRQAEPNPWDTIEQQFPVNTTIKGKVTKIMEYGAFVEILPGVEGLVHISALADHRVRAVGDIVQEGQEVDVRVIKIDREQQRVSLSMRPEAPAQHEAPAAHPEKPGDKKHKNRPARGGLSSHFDWMGDGLRGLNRQG
jgi:small subunit ribosomal protein S1